MALLSLSLNFSSSGMNIGTLPMGVDYYEEGCKGAYEEAEFYHVSIFDGAV